MYERIISLDNLFDAWREFLKGKRKKRDVLLFSEALSTQIYNLHINLINREYVHGKYSVFNISDPKPRNIHKAAVRDRLLHHAIYRVLYPSFDKKFIHDSYSCRLDKGTHKAMNRFRSFAYKVSKNNTKQCWVLKCDIKKFFASIDQEVLLVVLKKRIQDADTLWLLERIIKSFDSGTAGKGLPLGNLTSQLLVNIYMNEFDQFVKHKLKAEYYIRYADDFVVLSRDKIYLEQMLPLMQDFLKERLKLSMHPDKISIRTIASGVDFLGWVHFPDHRVLRTATKRRMIKKLERSVSKESLESYKGLLKHGNTHKILRRLPTSTSS